MSSGNATANIILAALEANARKILSDSSAETEKRRFLESLCALIEDQAVSAEVKSALLGSDYHEGLRSLVKHISIQPKAE